MLKLGKLIFGYILINMFVLPYCVLAGSVVLSWNDNNEADLSGYRVYSGTQSRIYGVPVFVGKSTQYEISDLIEGKIYFFSVTAVDNSGNESGYSLEISKMIESQFPDQSPPTSSDLVSNVISVSGKDYVIEEGLNTNSICYIDKNWNYQSIPDFLIATTFIKTAVYDRSYKGDSFLSFDLGQNATVYVMMDDRVTLPSWMADFEDTGKDAIVVGYKFSVYSKEFTAGKTVLGGANSNALMYLVAVAGNNLSSTADTEVPQITITSPTGSSFTSAKLDVKGTASDNVGVSKVEWRNSTGGSGVASGTESWTIAGLTLAEGKNTITVDVFDEAGNKNSAFLGLTYIAPDTEVPKIVITSPTGSSFTSATVDIKGTASDNIGVSKIEWNNSTGASGVASGTEIWSIAGLTLAEGKNTITVDVFDEAGNKNSAFLALTYIPPDTEAPEIAITSPLTNTVNTSKIDVKGKAIDNVGVYKVEWNNSTGGSGVASGTESWSIAGLTLAEGKNTITIDVFDSAGNKNSVSLELTYLPPSLVSNVEAASGKSYVVEDGLKNGSTFYIDKTWNYNDIPEFLAGATFIKTAVYDRNYNTESFLSFDLAKEATIYMIMDNRVSLPSWMTGFQDTGSDVSLIGYKFSIYSKQFSPGRVVLGGANSKLLMYSVAIDDNVSAAQGEPVQTPSTMITNVEALSGKNYIVEEGLNTDSVFYIDKDWKYSDIPEFLTGAAYIRTAVYDRNYGGDSFLSFDLNQAATIYIVMDDRVPLPSWMVGFQDTGSDATIIGYKFSVYAKQYSAGKIVLGGANSNSLMYTVAIK